MFREMLRKNQALSPEDCLRLLTEETRGVLSVLGDDGYPYGMPMNHLYAPEEGLLYFHGGKQGHKLDALRRDPRASYCVFDGGVRREGDWALTVRSVVVFGKVSFIRDPETVERICRRLCTKFTQDEAYIRDELERFGPRTLLLALSPEHISGKLVREA